MAGIDQTEDGTNSSVILSFEAVLAIALTSEL
jgi:hypothetical protein